MLSGIIYILSAIVFAVIDIAIAWLLINDKDSKSVLEKILTVVEWLGVVFIGLYVITIFLAGIDMLR